MNYAGMNRPAGRPKQFYNYELPSSVVKIVRAQCADFKRKEDALKSGAVKGEILLSYSVTNAAIKKALDTIEEPCREFFLSDIAENRGYDKSKSQWLLSHNAYYARKRKAIYDVAKFLLLI